MLFPSSSVDLPHGLKLFKIKLLLGGVLDISFGAYSLALAWSFPQLYCRYLLQCDSLPSCSTMVSWKGLQGNPGSYIWINFSWSIFSQLGSSHHFLITVPVHHFALSPLLSPRCHHLSLHVCIPSQLLLLTPDHLLVEQREKQSRPWHCSAPNKISSSYNSLFRVNLKHGSIKVTLKTINYNMSQPNQYIWLSMWGDTPFPLHTTCIFPSS